MPDSEVNPFQQIINEIWVLLESHTFFTEAVKKGNRIKFDKPDPIKQEIATADVPEVIVSSTTLTLQYDRTSNGTSLTKRFDVLISSGSFDLTKGFYQVEWEIIRAFSGWRTLLDELSWSGDVFVQDVRLITGNEGLSDPERNRGIQGWSSALAVEVDMWFTASKLHPV